MSGARGIERVLTEQGAAAAILDEAGRLLVVRENDERRRYGFPGGAVEPGEAPQDAVVREVLEETGITVSVDHLVGMYRLENGLMKTVFRCHIVSGVPARIAPEEIAEVGWFAPEAIPPPVTNSLRYALPDVLGGARGVVRDGLRALT